MELKIIKLVEGLDDICYSRQGDCGLDLRASGRWIVDLDSSKKEIEQDKYQLKPGERILIKTGIKMAIPQGYWGNIRDRSGLAFKHEIHTLGGVIDSNYREEISVIVVNHGILSYDLTKNERIAQIIIQKYETVQVHYVQDLDSTNRSDGFGSSGTH
ncbi:dUTP diphosphatase [Candidatus Woesearchaeota archaeon]|nr:dUTP diphosphatase [Candidatus Woesearchaeota archaeon]